MSTYPHKVLLVDDEQSILRSLQRLFRKHDYEILAATSGKEALEILSRFGEDVSLIISDQRMPGMTGSQFLEKAYEIAPKSIRFLLTGYADLSAIADAINNGRINRYITKPWNDQELRELVQTALSQVELQRENRRLRDLVEQQNRQLISLNKELEKKVQERTWALQVQNKMLNGKNDSLEKSLMKTVHLLTSLMEYRNSRLAGFMRDTAQLAKEIAVRAGLDEKRQNTIEMAGLVQDIGLLGIPEHILGKDQKFMNNNEFKVFSQHPQIAGLSLSSAEGFEEVSAMVLCHHEYEDGSGFPQRLRSEHIPLGAKILTVASDYCTILDLWPANVKDFMVYARRYLDKDSWSEMDITDDAFRMEIAENIIFQGAGTRYDPTIVNGLKELLEDKHPRPKITEIKAASLETGMTLMQDLRLQDGRLLLCKGTLLNDHCIGSIRNIGLTNFAGDTIKVTVS